MKIHELKTQSQFFQHVATGAKNFEVRKDDRDYEVGDFVLLIEIVKLPNTNFFNPSNPQEPPEIQWRETSKKLSARISYILRYDEFPDGIQPGYCVLGLESIKEYQPSW